MYPAPSARKYCRNFRGQSLRTTKYPPTKFPAAATSPSPAASPVRNARSCTIAGVTGGTCPDRVGSLCKPSIHLGRNPWSKNYPRPFFSVPSGSSANSVLILAFFFTSLLPCFSTSSGMPEQNHIPFLHDVFFPLQSHLRFFPRRRQTPRGQQILPPHHFRPNETLLDVAMNRPRRLHRRRSLSNRPRPHFRLPRREKLDQPHQIISRAN